MFIQIFFLTTLSHYSDVGNIFVGRIGKPLKVISSNSHYTCHSHCSKDQRCTAWSWHKCEESCHLFDKDEKTLFENIAGATCGGVSGSLSSMNTIPGSYTSLKLGDITPTGWLLRQLKLQATGQAGHLTEFWDDVEHSIWIGGTYDHMGAGHERGPYWLNGQVPLAALLNASIPNDEDTTSVVNQTEYWIHYVLQNWVNNATGWLGPDDGFGDPYWSGWNMAVSLLQYSTAHEDTDIATLCNTVVLNYLTTTYTRMTKSALGGWSQTRYQDLAYIAQLLSEIAPGLNHKQVLYDLAVLATYQGINWVHYYNRIGPTKVPEMNVPKWNMQSHGVNNAMGTKAASVGGWIGSEGKITKSDLDHQLATQDKWHGQPHGMFSADECFGGKGLSRGIELCAVVEQMYSLQASFRQFGDVSYIDRAERIALNALPGTISSDMWQHQYLQQVNSISASYNQTNHVWQTDGLNSTGFGVAPNFGCCTANHPQGWPKLTQSSFSLYQSGNTTGVAVVFFAPAKLNISTGAIKGVEVEMITEYPFDDLITLRTTLPNNIPSIPLRVRIPLWASKSTIHLNGKVVTSTPGVMNEFIISQLSTTIVINLSFEVRVEAGWGEGNTNAMAVYVGPILYGLPLQEITRVVNVWKPFNNTDINITTTDKWNFVLVVNPSDLTKTLKFNKKHLSNKEPFETGNYTSTVTATARSINTWTENTTTASIGIPPASPYNCSTFPGTCSDDVQINLVPYGATNIRLSAMPWICINTNYDLCYQGINRINSQTSSQTLSYGEVEFDGSATWVDDVGNDVAYWIGGIKNNPASITFLSIILEPTAVLTEIKFQFQYTTQKYAEGFNKFTNFTVELIDLNTNTVTNIGESSSYSLYPFWERVWSPLETVTFKVNKTITTPHRVVTTFHNSGKELYLKTPFVLSYNWQ